MQCRGTRGARGRFRLSLLGALSLVACGGTADNYTFGTDGAPPVTIAPWMDASALLDAGNIGEDATLPPDAATPGDDAAVAPDGNADDSSTAGDASFDATGTGDTGAPLDSGDGDAEGDDDGGGNSTCSVKIHKAANAGILCPKSRTGPAALIECQAGSQVCCVSTDEDAGASTCAAGTTCPAKESVWACSNPGNCQGSTGGPTCCLTATSLQTDANCAAFEQAKGRPSTRCTAASTCGGTVAVGKTTESEYVVCLTDGDCPKGTSCTPVRVLGTGIGLCL